MSAQVGVRPEFALHRDAGGRRRRKRPHRVASRPITLRVDPRVWKVALSLSGGDLRRIEVLSETSVRVR